MNAQNAKTTIAGALVALCAACGVVWPKYSPIFAALGGVVTAVGFALAADAKKGRP